MNMTMMKDVSLKDTKAKGEFLYYKVQDIVWDDVFSKYITHKGVRLLFFNTLSVRLPQLHLSLQVSKIARILPE